ncbi:unnamed protein product [Closterium sp. NIES-54]
MAGRRERQTVAFLLLLSTMSLATAQILPAATNSSASTAATTTAATTAAPIATAVAGALSSCSKSAMPGFTSALKLAPGIVMHWNANNNGKTIPLAVEASGAAARGWFSVAFSFSGLMSPSDAVVGNPGNAISAYHVASYSSVAPARGINLGAKSCASSGGKTVMKFSRSVGDGGSVPVRVKGVNKIIWGFSTNGGKTVAYHGANIGSTQVNFACNGASPGKPTPSPPVKKPPPVPVVPPSQRSKLCPWSTLPGFTYMLELKPLAVSPNLSFSPSLPLSLSPSLPRDPFTLSNSPSNQSAGALVAGEPERHRDVNKNVIELAMEAKPGSGANNGWLSLAWSSSGRMAPADAIIGNRMGGTLGSYLITGYTMQSLKPAAIPLGAYPTVFKRGTGSTVMM